MSRKHMNIMGKKIVTAFINDDDDFFFSTSENQREESLISFDDDFVDIQFINRSKKWITNWICGEEIPNPDPKFHLEDYLVYKKR